MGLHYRRRYVVLLTVVAACWIRLVILACQDPPPIYSPYEEGQPPLGTHMHCHVPPDYDEEHELCILDMWTGEEVTGSRYVAWASGRTLQDYRGLAVVAPVEWVDDMDVVRYWNHQRNGYDDPSTCYDGSRWMGDASFWNSVQKAPDWHPPGDGTLSYIVQWFDDDYLSPGSYAPGSCDPEMPYDYATVPVVNNTYAGWSYLLAGNRYLSRHGIDDSYPPPPVPYTIFNGGKVHIAVGDTLPVSQLRHVISYEVDRYTAASKIVWLEAGMQWVEYFFAPEDDPNRGPHIWAPTLNPQAWGIQINHSGVPPMLTPSHDNAVMTGTVVVVKGDLGMPNRVPNNPAEDLTEIPPPVIPWSVGPNPGVEVAQREDAIIAELYNPKNAAQKRTKLLGGGSLSGSFYWNGRFDDNTFCPTNAAFGRIKVTVRDHWWNGTEQLTESQLTFEAPLLAILFPSHPFRTGGGPYCYGDQTISWTPLAPLEVGWNPPNLYTNPTTFWQCSWGTIEAPEGNPSAYTPWSVTPGQKMVVTLTVSVNGNVRTRGIEVFGDHLGRDMQNFMGGTNAYPLIWWYHPSNCHGATRHAHDGSGTLIENPFQCPYGGSCINAPIYDTRSGIDLIDTFPKQRGDIVEYSSGDGPGFHSATLTGGGTTTWEVNGGVPSDNHFRTDEIHREIATVIRLHGPQRP